MNRVTSLRSLVSAAVLCALAASARGQEPTRVVLLGTGTPLADPERSGPAVAVIAGGRPYLVDCGPGVVRRAAAAERAGVGELAVKNLDIVFVTHLHSDHTLGCPDLLLSPWVLERTAPLRVFGPPGAKAMFEHILAAYAADVQNRTEGLQPHNDTGWRAEVTEIAPGEVYADEHVRVTAFLVDHTTWEQSYGYRFEASDRAIVISGDTRPTEAIVDACDGCDVLVHEVYSTSELARREPEWQRYHADAHTSADELAGIASRARPGLLVLYHQLFWGASEEDLVAEVARGYDGRIVSGHDLDIF